MDKKTVEYIESLIGENERLRVLLADARNAIDEIYDRTALIRRIDTALAEPTHNKGKA